MNITIQGMSVSDCGHKVVQTDKGNIPVHLSMIQNAAPDNLPEYIEAAIIVLKHQYLTRRAAGRTHAQAMADLVGFVVRI